MKTNPIVIFHQGGNNRRIGNSTKWVGPALAWCKENDFEFFLPTAKLIFDGILSDRSGLFHAPGKLMKSPLFSKLMLSKEHVYLVDKFLYRCVTSANEVASVVYDAERCITIFPGSLGVIRDTAGIDWNAPEIGQFIQSNEVTVINEPFPFEVPNNNIELLRKEYLLPSDGAIARAEKTKSKKIAVIGIHIRQTDYKKWLGGKYYKNNEFYNDLILGIIETLLVECDYFIAHDGDFIPSEVLLKHPNVNISKGTEAEVTSDFLNFAVCDYILGSDSTFSLQAMKLGRLWFSMVNRFIAIEPGEPASKFVERFILEVEKREKMLCR